MPTRRRAPLILALVVAAVAYFAWLSALRFADVGAERGSHEVAAGTGFWLAVGLLVIALWFFGASLRWWAWIPLVLWLPALVLVVAPDEAPASQVATQAPAVVSSVSHETIPVATTTPTTTASPPTQNTLASPPPAPPPMQRCTERGIRYAGRGPDHVRVCFTLTRDGSAWLEISYAFVPPADCGDRRGEATYLGPPAVPLTRPGVIDLLFDGAIFYAIIDGPTATGSITDPDVCGSQKRFTWRARRVSR